MCIHPRVRAFNGVKNNRKRLARKAENRARHQQLRLLARDEFKRLQASLCFFQHFLRLVDLFDVRLDRHGIFDVLAQKFLGSLFVQVCAGMYSRNCVSARKTSMKRGRTAQCAATCHATIRTPSPTPRVSNNVCSSMTPARTCQLRRTQGRQQQAGAGMQRYLNRMVEVRFQLGDIVPE